MNLLLSFLGAIIASPVVFFLWMHSSRLRGNDADALIILGYKCENDELHPYLKERLDTAVKLMSRHNYSRVLLSGGSVASKRSEACIMEQYLIRCGVDPQRIVLEQWSRNTVHNMVNCRLLMDEHGLKTCVVVSNSFHIRRMKYIVRSLGMEADFFADRSPSTIMKQWRLTMQEIRAFRLTLPWLEKAAQLGRNEMMGKMPNH